MTVSKLLVLFRSCLRPIERTPIRAPLARALASRLASDVLHRADAADQESQHLAQTRFVERAADTSWCGPERDRARHVEQERAADASQMPGQIPLGNPPRAAQRHRSGNECRHRAEQLARERRNREIGFLGENPSGGAKYRLGVGTTTDQPREGDSFILRRSLPAANRFAVTSDLRVYRLAQSEPLVPQLVNVFGLQSVCRRVDVADCLEQAEREESVNGGEHRDAS